MVFLSDPTRENRGHRAGGWVPIGGAVVIKPVNDEDFDVLSETELKKDEKA